jgi:hypothetical protein
MLTEVSKIASPLELQELVGNHQAIQAFFALLGNSLVVADCGRIAWPDIANHPMSHIVKRHGDVRNEFMPGRPG